MERGVKGFGCFGADAGEQDIGGDDEQIGREAAADAGDGRQQPGNRVAADGEKHQGAQRRHNHQRGIGGDVAEEGDKQHHIAGVTGANVR